MDESRHYRIAITGGGQWWTGDRWTAHIAEAQIYTLPEARTANAALRAHGLYNGVIEYDDTDLFDGAED